MNDLYDTGFALWSEAALLRRMGNHERVNNQVDWGNVAEEIESLGRNDRREIRSRLICEHLLKWQFQQRCDQTAGTTPFAGPRRDRGSDRGKSIARGLSGSTARRPKGAYVRGRRNAAAETGFTHLPETCP
jgi:hypothetical protein